MKSQDSHPHMVVASSGQVSGVNRSQTVNLNFYLYQVVTMWCPSSPTGMMSRESVKAGVNKIQNATQCKYALFY